MKIVFAYSLFNLNFDVDILCYNDKSRHRIMCNTTQMYKM